MEEQPTDDGAEPRPFAQPSAWEHEDDVQRELDELSAAVGPKVSARSARFVQRSEERRREALRAAAAAAAAPSPARAVRAEARLACLRGSPSARAGHAFASA